MNQPKNKVYPNRRGSMLIAAIIFSMLAFVMIGAMLPSYVTDYRAAVQNRLYSAAFSLAEAGAEEAVWAAYNNRWEVNAWNTDADWKIVNDALGNPYYARRVEFPNMTFGGGHTGYARVAVGQPAAGQNLELIAQGVILDASGREVLTRVIRVNADELTPFVGFVAKDKLDLGSGTIVSATNTDQHPTVVDALNDRDSNGKVGSLSTADNSILLSNTNQKTQANMIAFQIGTVMTGSNVFTDAVQYSGTVLNQETNFSASFPTIAHPAASGNNGPSAF